MRPYEKLKTIYEIASRMIVRGEGAWKDYLSFAARIHKYSFDNALLVYAQNPDVTTLASIPQWNKVGRNVNRGSKGIAVCEYENAKLTLSYLFDMDSTITAYYTEPELIKSIYTALDNFGFEGGKNRKLLDKTTPRLIQFHTLKNAVNPPFLGGFSVFGAMAA